MKYICPLLVVEDIEISKKFYLDNMEQKIKYDFGENVVFEGDFAIHLKDHYLKLPGFKTVTEIIKKSNNFELYFETAKLETIFNKLNKEGIQFIHGISEQPQGQRVIRVYDPDEHIIEIGEKLESVAIRLSKEGLTIKEICEKLSMPEDFVKNALK